jgi:putative endonuclease
MARIHETGRAGEALAVRALEAAGWTVLSRNWRDGPRELDLVVYRAGVLAFIEVKTRRSLRWGDPLEAILPGKQREIERAAGGWLSREAHRVPRPFSIRFDAVSVLIPARGAPEVQIFEDAWHPSP